MKGSAFPPTVRVGSGTLRKVFTLSHPDNFLGQRVSPSISCVFILVLRTNSHELVRQIRRFSVLSSAGNS